MADIKKFLSFLADDKRINKKVLLQYKEWLAQKYDVSDWTDSEVEVANTGSIIFAGADITIQDCIEDLSFKIGLE